MKEKISLRQVELTFLLLSITPIFTLLPNLLANIDSDAGYLSILYYAVLFLVFVLLLYQILKSCTGISIYEVLSQILGSFIAKLIVLCYAIWAFFTVLLKVSSYNALLQTTLMPTIPSGILLAFLFLLVSYTLTKGIKTIFRFGEFSYIPILFFLVLLLFFALPSFDFEQLHPIIPDDLGESLEGIPFIASIGGNLFFFLFFMERISAYKSPEMMRHRLLSGVLQFSLISLISVVSCFAISGTTLTAKLSYPVFQSVKSVSILNTFERFDSFITMICIISDFASICIFMLMLMQCINYLIPNTKDKAIGVGIFFIICSYVGIRSVTQFELEQELTGLYATVTLIMQYLLPVILGIIFLFRKKPQQE